MEKYTREQLEGMNFKREIIPLARTLDIKGRQHMKKDELISSIISYQQQERQQEFVFSQYPEMENREPEIVKSERKNNLNDVLKKVMNSDLQLCGTLAAYYLNGILTTGMIYSADLREENGVIIGSMYIQNISKKYDTIPLDDIEWLKLKSRRWPSFIYKELKENRAAYEKNRGLKNEN